MPSRRPSAPRRPATRPGARPASRTTGRGRSTGASKSPGSSGTKNAKATGGNTRRPSGPARDERRRSRLGLVLPEVLTVRMLALGVVLLLAFVLLLPTVRGAVQQQAEIDRLQAELAAHESERDELTNELARWDDRSYVVQQARSRLSYILPGDTPWRVVDGDTVPDGGPTDPQAAEDAQQDRSRMPVVPWYQAMWESVQVADDPDAGLLPADESDGSDAGDVAPEESDGGG